MKGRPQGVVPHCYSQSKYLVLLVELGKYACWDEVVHKEIFFGFNGMEGRSHRTMKRMVGQ